ncbi:hypothetical protein [Natronomonas salsuginis]|uniref:PH domain-containing protein n=1 Tax=Natronomonas salsuginis TaxID=2217661 RepID=A0A4U5JCB7_9EURY|nr:hypothetical protein [Natronomonas salsuginis]TKR25217.1 hypothetical protein DM868_10605 [Natronomonas salsuginis]
MPSLEWSIDASTSRPLRTVAHLSPAALGGALLLVLGAGLVFVVTNPTVLFSGPGLVLLLLLVIGGPFSLAYLWPMLTDPEQRPSTAEFAGAEGFPFSVRSVSIAAASGAVVILGLVVVGVPFEVVYWLVVVCVFSPILVAMATTRGELDGEGLAINRTEVPLARLRRVRSARLGDHTVVWLSYVERTGLFVPRLFVVPRSKREAVLDRLDAGVDADPAIEPPDRAVQTVLLIGGALFLGVAALASVSIDEPAIRLYAAVVLGGIGAALGLAGWRGI